MPALTALLGATSRSWFPHARARSPTVVNGRLADVHSTRVPAYAPKCPAVQGVLRAVRGEGLS